MTPAESKNTNISYCFSDSPFGKILLASTEKGICYLAFETAASNGLPELHATFPHATISQTSASAHEKYLSVFETGAFHTTPIPLHIKGTPFQLTVWHALLRIPFGRRCSYLDIAKEIGQPTASRAVGNAVGKNPVSFFIPCHRVVQKSGKLGGYMWGPERKAALLVWEA